MINPEALCVCLQGVRGDLYQVAQRLAASGAGEMTAEQHIEQILEERRERKAAKKERKRLRKLKREAKEARRLKRDGDEARS
jgi:hypothetical protein